MPDYRLVRLYLSEKGIWCYEFERDGKIRWSSLCTRDEGEARKIYEHLCKRLRMYQRERGEIRDTYGDDDKRCPDRLMGIYTG
jgi:hypothetical protein